MSSPLRNPRLQLMLVIGLITASGFWIWWFSKYQPRMEDIQTLVEQENRLRISNQQARRTVAALGLDRIQKAIDAYDRQAEHVAELVPADTVSFDALSVVSERAQQFDVRIGGVQPQRDETSGGFLVKKYQIRATGEYHDVAALMSDLLSLPRITRLSEAQIRQIQQPPATPGAPPNHLVEAVFTLNVYATRVEAEKEETARSSRTTGTPSREGT